eukprot:XP_011683196.1 PREDICTED: uncharacterized protein LOC105447151 [Strongylocentrotus purpuratus]
MNMLRHWRSLVKPPTYNPRTALADAVFPVLGRKKALDIISGKIRHDGIQKGNVIGFIRDGIEYLQAFNIANVIGVQHSSSETGELTFKQVLGIWQESLKNEPLADNQREELCKRLDDGGFKALSSKLHQGEYLQVTGDILQIMEKAIKHDVAGNVSDVIDVKVKPFEGTLTVNQVLKEWEDKLRINPLEQQERILLSNRLLKGGYKEFSFEVMLGFVPKPLEPKEAANNDQTLTIKSALLQGLQALSSVS